MSNNSQKYNFIDANPPHFAKLTDVYVGDVKGKIAVERRTEEENSDSSPKRGIFKPMHESFKKRRNNKKYRFANHYGEFVAYKISEKIGIPACKVELAKRNFRNRYTGKNEIAEGCISYIHTENNEQLIHGMTIMEYYGREALKDRLPSSKNNNIDIIIPALKYYLEEHVKCSKEEINRICDNFIQMVVFDCAFGNSDRNDENWGIIIKNTNDPKSSKADIYPMFDNERILGFMERKDVVEKIITDERAINDYSNQVLNSRMGFQSTNEKVNYNNMIKYLLSAYPVSTKKALDKILSFKEKDLDEILENCEGLDDCYKIFAKEIHTSRITNIIQTLNQFYAERKTEGQEI